MARGKDINRTDTWKRGKEEKGKEEKEKGERREGKRTETGACLKGRRRSRRRLGDRETGKKAAVRTEGIFFLVFVLHAACGAMALEKPASKKFQNNSRKKI
jgi:hypothetical protein